MPDRYTQRISLSLIYNHPESCGAKILRKKLCWFNRRAFTTCSLHQRAPKKYYSATSAQPAIYRYTDVCTKPSALLYARAKVSTRRVRRQILNKHHPVISALGPVVRRELAIHIQFRLSECVTQRAACAY